MKKITLLLVLCSFSNLFAQKEQQDYEEKKAVLEANNLSTEELTRQHLEKLALIQKE